MEVIPRFQRAIDALYDRLGIDAEYWPADGRAPESLRVIPRRPERYFELGEAQIHAEDPQFEFRVSDWDNPMRGDDIHFNEQIYRIDSEPRLEQHQLVWIVETLPL